MNTSLCTAYASPILLELWSSSNGVTGSGLSSGRNFGLVGGTSIACFWVADKSASLVCLLIWEASRNRVSSSVDFRGDDLLPALGVDL